MDFTATNFLNDLLLFFQQHSVVGMMALKPHAQQLVCVLAIIDLCSTWTLYDGEVRMSQMISKVMKVGFLLFLIVNCDKLSSAILTSFQYAGATAAGVTDFSNTEWITPSNILNQGFNVSADLLKELHETSIMSGGGLGKSMMILIAIIITVGAFFFIALQVLMTKIEFCIFASFSVILLPFGAIRYLSFLFQRAVSAVFAFGVKLMVMFFLLGLINSLVGDVKAISATSQFSDMLRVSLSYAVLGYLTWKLPTLAAGMMSGQPSMEADQAISSGAATVATAASGVGGAVSKAASSAGNYKATMNATRAATAPGSSSAKLAGNFARNIARQKFGNSTIGKSLIKGANNAMNHLEDYNNIKSGDAFKRQQGNRNDSK